MSDLAQTPYKSPSIPTRSPEDLKKLQTKQMAIFLGLGAIVISSSLASRKAVLNRRYIPLLFDANNKPPSYNFVKDAALAVSHASVMAVSSFGFAVVGFAWLSEIKSLREFSIKMKNAFGAAAKEEVYLNAPEDNSPETLKLESSLEGVFGKK